MEKRSRCLFAYQYFTFSLLPELRMSIKYDTASNKVLWQQTAASSSCLGFTYLSYTNTQSHLFSNQSLQIAPVTIRLLCLGFCHCRFRMCVFFHDGVVNLTPNPRLGGLAADFCLDSTLKTARPGKTCQELNPGNSYKSH